MFQKKRIVITGVGLTAPNGNNLSEFRDSLLSGKSGIKAFKTRFMEDTIAGICDFDKYKYQKKKEVRRGTRAGNISVYCANEALADAGISLAEQDTSRVGVYIGITEHGNVETENEIHAISQYNYNTDYWTHHHNPRTVANNPAGEVTISLKITGPHYCIGGACAAGNLGIIQGYQMLQLEDVDIAIAGGVSEVIHTFGIFASFKSQNALAKHESPEKASRPFDKSRNGVVVSEGGCLFVLETLEHALDRGAKIYGEIVGYAANSDANDFVQPYSVRQEECLRLLLKRAGLEPGDIDLINTHATSTPIGDIEEAKAIRNIFGNSENVYINNTKGFIGHTMGAAGALELAGNLPSFNDGIIHPFLNLDDLDPECEIPNIVDKEPKKVNNLKYVINNSFGMLGINSAVVVKKYRE